MLGWMRLALGTVDLEATDMWWKQIEGTCVEAFKRFKKNALRI
jgi:hypothetical protein